MPSQKYKTKSGEVKWYTSFWYTNWAGKRVRKKKEGFALKREADDYEKEFLRQSDHRCDMTFASLVELYQADMDVRVRSGTQMGRDSILHNWVLPYFKDRRVDEITPAMVRAWQKEIMSKTNPRSGKKYSESYLHDIHVRLSAILKFAVTYYGLPQNPCDVAGSMGSTKTKKNTIWTLEQFATFLQEVQAPGLRLAFQILYWTGVRAGECLALTPSDILPTKEIHIEKTYHRLKGQDTVGPPKTDNSYRNVGLPDFLYDEILVYISRLYGVEPTSRIFYFGKSALEVELRKATRAAGLPPIRVHDLRHSHASLIAELGYTISDVADRLGDTPATAMTTYVKLFPERPQQVTSGLNRVAEQLSDVRKSPPPDTTQE